MNLFNAKRILPSIFTLGNLLCGFLAINNVIEGSYASAAWWIIIAGIFDALDGKIARLTGSSSEFGIEFDSIADVISFGIAPAVLIYHYALIEGGRIGYFLAFCFLAAGAIRLARFNLKATTGKKTHFTGMPIPAGAGILASYVLFCENVWNELAQFDIVIVLTILSSLAMVSHFKYNIMPRIGFGTRRDSIRSIWFICHILIIARFPDEVFFPTGILYLISGPIKSLTAPAVNHVFNKADSR
ncbi:MAG: CDP-diacylglycerol--serine O-phosphatidyltransferase [Candidatus Latescibacteria bacterium]|nr:CDP-diacylglycerol--serine O-phosphatidyltransferase [Candidatus Latescibacterota bacterium]